MANTIRLEPDFMSQNNPHWKRLPINFRMIIRNLNYDDQFIVVAEDREGLLELLYQIGPDSPIINLNGTPIKEEDYEILKDRSSIEDLVLILRPELKEIERTVLALRTNPSQIEKRKAFEKMLSRMYGQEDILLDLSEFLDEVEIYNKTYGIVNKPQPKVEVLEFIPISEYKVPIVQSTSGPKTEEKVIIEDNNNKPKVLRIEDFLFFHPCQEDYNQHGSDLKIKNDFLNKTESDFSLKFHQVETGGKKSRKQNKRANVVRNKQMWTDLRYNCGISRFPKQYWKET